MGFKEFLKRRSLKTRDDARTKAAELTLRQSIYPICLVTVLFFLWGFSYGLLDTLNKHFQNALGIEKSRSAGLQAAYFGAYPLASLGHANWILRHYGYRATFIWGLVLYCIGALVAWPCIEARSFGGFCAAIFIIGNGLGSLETAANPYITVCGPPRYSEMRINLSQAFNGIGTIVAPLIGSVAFFGLDDEAVAIANVKWVYIAIAAFVLLLAFLFFMSDIPEITDADMAHQAEETHAGSGDQPFRKQYRLFHAAFAQFCYVGAQVAVASYFINYVDATRPESGDVMASQLFAGAQGAFALGRFLGVFLMKFIKPRIVFLAFLTCCTIFIIPAIVLGHNAGIAMLYIVLFFESICFPTIVALGMRGLGRHSKRGSGFIVGGVLGGAVVPPLTGVVADHKGTGMAMVIPLIFFVLASSYSFAVNFVPSYRDNADAFTNTKVGLKGTDSPAAIEKGSVEGVVTEQSHHESKHLQ